MTTTDKPSITDAAVRAHRNTLFGAAYNYRAWLTCQIALGNREPYEGMSREMARKWVEQQIGAQP